MSPPYDGSAVIGVTRNLVWPTLSVTLCVGFLLLSIKPYRQPIELLAGRVLNTTVRARFGMGSCDSPWVVDT